MAEIKIVRSNDELVVLVNEAMVEADNWERRAESARLRAGKLLVELREKVEAEGLRWWEYYGQKFTRHRGDAEKVMAMAQAEDPIAAQEQERTTNRERMREVRGRRENTSTESTPAHSAREKYQAKSKPALEVVPPSTESPIQTDLIEQALALVRQMNIATRARFAAQLRQIWRT
jgi:hypothetical protein